MAKSKRVSAGLLLYRRRDRELECFIAHPGGPFWRNRHEGAWTIPKGLVEADEEHLTAAIREFREETGVEPKGPFQALGWIRLKSGKVIHAWAWEGDADPAAIRSNTARQEWPRASGRWISYPEVDRCGWFAPDEAKRLMNPAQAELVTRLQRLLGDGDGPTDRKDDDR
ncbi:MAG TPA: NUDIX domain-containing protein [Longimicrobiaceae bacterium]|nr:NUDIX domain-containing protein [Longimicrobiaceae bacterium]